MPPHKVFPFSQVLVFSLSCHSNGKETQNRMTAAKVGVGKGKREDGICVHAAQLAECDGKSMKGKCPVL